MDGGVDEVVVGADVEAEVVVPMVDLAVEEATIISVFKPTILQVKTFNIRYLLDNLNTSLSHNHGKDLLLNIFKGHQCLPLSINTLLCQM